MLTEVETSGDVDSRSVKITFPDGIIEISVCRPYSENGICIPYDYVVYKDQDESPLIIDKMSGLSLINNI